MKIRAERNKQTKTASQSAKYQIRTDKLALLSQMWGWLYGLVGWLAGWLKQKRLTIKINLNIYQENEKNKQQK